MTPINRTRWLALNGMFVSAGNVALPYHGRRGGQCKSDQSAITPADAAVEKFLTAELREAFPGISIIGEEDTRIFGSSGITAWLDPVDGTREFDAGLPFWSVSGGLYRETTPIWGGVRAPITNETFSTCDGRALLRNEPITCREPTETCIHGDLICLPGSYHRRLTTDFPGRTSSLGSIALEICYVAAGRLIGAVSSHINFWDIAGALAILRAAGGDAYLVETGEPLDLAGMLDCHKERRLVLYCANGMQDIIRKHIHALPFTPTI